MSEYPSRSCGPCPHLAHFQKLEKPNDYLTQGSLPEPAVETRPHVQFAQQLGVPHTYQQPDLTVPPNADQRRNGPYLGGIPPCADGHPCDAPCLYESKTNIVEPPCERNPYSLEGIGGFVDKKPRQLCDTQPQMEVIPPPPKQGILKHSPETKALGQPGTALHAAAGRTHPLEADPATKPPVPGEQRGPREIACYLPQPEDTIPEQHSKGDMGPIGPWATGRVDWAPLAGLTGTRPVVDKYSITRYSEGEWRKFNKDILDMATGEQHKANMIDWNSRQCLQKSDTDKNQEDNTKRLLQRELEIHRWKCELERAIAASSEEITFMEEQRLRLKQASAVLQMPESIAGECLERRTGRLDSELVRDEVEEELIKELALCAEIRDTFSRTLKDVELQLLEDKTAKQRLEYDWSDKKQCHELETINVALNTRSTILMFKPGAVIMPDDQSTIEYWEHFTRETLQEGEATRQRSVALRGTLDAILNNAARDLRSQADRVELALSKRVSCTEEVAKKLENELIKILQRLADVEDLIADLRAAIRKLDLPMKKAQTRLDNRLLRPRVENCRDEVHFSLIDEVKSIAETLAALQAQLSQAEASQASLMKARSELEREVMVKRKTLEIDRERTQLIRSYYPSATALSGY